MRTKSDALPNRPARPQRSGRTLESENRILASTSVAASGGGSDEPPGRGASSAMHGRSRKSKLWSPSLSDDHVLRGAKEIAAVYYDDASMDRHIYYRVQKGRFPHFREGTIGICVRVGTLRRWVEAQEARSTRGEACGPADLVREMGLDA